MPKKPYQSIAVVVRYTRYDTDDPQQRIDLKEAFPSFDEADAEAARLNDLVSDDPTIEYFVEPVRYYYEGREVDRGY